MSIEAERLSNTKTRRLRAVIREYSKQLGLPDPGDRFTAKQHIIRICSKFPRIAAAVRPLGGKLDGEQCLRFFRYMVEHPIGGVKVAPAAIYNRPEKVNMRVERRVLQKARKGEREKRQQFYDSWEWKAARYKVLQKHGPVCMLCGSTRKDLDLDGKPVRIVVDHIKPLHTHWAMRLNLDNLQVLCHDCNMGKGAWDTTDWREERPPEQAALDQMIVDQLTPRN